MPVYGLYEKKISEQGSVHTQEVVSGIENMQILYGLGDTYKPATELKSSDWDKVRSVKLALLLNSIDNVLEKSQDYEFKGKKFVGDKRMHKEWDMYVALREK